MTDFEIVEIENEYIRGQLQIAEQERIRQLQREEQERIAEREEIERIAEEQRIRIELENEQLRNQAEMEADITENEIEDRILNIENAIFAHNLAQAIRAIMPYQPMGPIPINITPPGSLTSSSSSTSYNYEDYYDKDWDETNHDSQESNRSHEDNEDNEEEQNNNEHYHHNDDDTPEAEYQNNLNNENAINTETTSEESTISNTSLNTTNESYNSAQSKHSDTPTTPPQLQPPENQTQPLPSRKSIPSPYKTLIASKLPPLPLRRNDITFLKEINELNRSPEGKSAPILSSIRPCYASSKDQDFFICHICHSFPRTEEWIKDKNEHPFVRNVGSILRHIRMNHCGKSEENRQLTRAAETYILSFKEDLKTRPVHPLFQTETSIPKALSMSCINTSWKSNQTEITKKVVNTYYFSPDKCGGHRRLFSTKGPVYNYDIDESIYCTCKTKPLRRRGNQKLEITPVSFHHGNSIQYNDDELQMFFNCEKGSIHQLHKTFLCNHTFPLNLPPKLPKYPEKFPKYNTYKTGTMETRMMKKKRISTNILLDNKPLIPLTQNKPPPMEKAKANTSQHKPEKEKEKARTSKGGYKAYAVTVARQGAATAAKLLDIKKKASRPNTPI